MNRTEATNLWRLAQAAAPQQAFDEWTPDAWALAFDDVPFSDARDALVRVVKSNAFIDIAAIRAQVRYVRDKRLADHPEPPPPDGLTVTEAIEFLRATRQAIADGNPPEVAAIDAPKRDMSAIEGTFR